MSDPIQLNKNVFDTFQRISKDQKITGQEARDLQQAIVADGSVDEGETLLLEHLKSPESGKYELSTVGGNRLDFEPLSLNLSKARAVLGKGDSLSAPFVKTWNKALNDGVIEAHELKQLKAQAGTPKDLQFLQLFEAGKEVDVTLPEGLDLRFKPGSKGFEIDQDYLDRQVHTLIFQGLKGSDPDPDAIRTLLRTLKHKVPQIQQSAQRLVDQHLGKKEVMDKAQILHNLHGIKGADLDQPWIRAIAKEVRTGIKPLYEAYGQELEQQLAAAERESDPQQLSLAYQNISASVNFYRELGNLKGPDPNFAKITASMERALQNLKDQGISLNTEQQINLAQGLYAFDKPKALKMLEDIVFTAAPAAETSHKTDPRDMALQFLIEHSPKAAEIARRIGEGEGKPSAYMQKNVGDYLRHQAKGKLDDYRQMLKSDDTDVRIQGIKGLSRLADPKAVDSLSKQYSLHASSLEEQSWIETALKDLARSPHDATAEAARKALRGIEAIQATGDSPRTYHALEPLLADPSKENLAKILEGLQDESLRPVVIKELAGVLEAASDTRPELLKRLSEAASGLTPELRKLTEPLLASYAAPLTMDKAWQRLDWLAGKPALQAKVIEATGYALPAQARELEKQLDGLLAQKGLKAGEKLALERARLPLDPAEAATRLEKLLALPDPGIGPADLQQALQAVLELTALEPEEALRFSKLMGNTILTGPPELAPALAKGIQAQHWPDRALYVGLLASEQPEVRNTALEELAHLAEKGDAAAVEALADHYSGSYRENERENIEGWLSDLSLGSGPAAEAAESRLSSLHGDGPVREEDPKEAYARKAANKELAGFYHGLEKMDSDLRDGLITDSMMGGTATKLEKYGNFYLKGKYASFLLGADERGLARGYLLGILNSTKSRAEFDMVMSVMRGKREQPPNLKAFFTKEQFAEYSHHRDNLYHFETNRQATTARMMGSAPAEKGEWVGKALADYRDGVLTLDETRDVVSRALNSLASQQEYDQVLKAMNQAFSGFDESSLIEVLGDKGFDEIGAKIGLQRARTGYSEAESLARDAQDFFDFVSGFAPTDGSLSYEGLDNQHPEIRQHPFFYRFFNNPTVEGRLEIARLIAENKVKVHGVSGHFADEFLFGKHSLGVFEIHGNLRLRDFLQGNVVDKARQFVAIDEFARMVHDTTQKSLLGRADELRALAAAPDKLAQALKTMSDYTEPYKAALKKGHELANFGAEIEKKPVIEALKKQNPGKDDAWYTQEYANLKAAWDMLQHYGSDAGKAVQKLEREAAKLEGAAAEMGVTGSYEDRRSYFMNYAFSMYNDKSADLLHSAFKEGINQLGPYREDLRKVLGKAEDLEDEIAMAKSVIVNVVGTLTGTELIVAGMQIAARIATHVGPNARKVDLGLRSQEAQDAAAKAIVWDIVTEAVTQGFKSYAKSLDAAVEKQATELFGDQIEDEVKKEARDVFVKNLKDRVKREVATLKAFYTSFEALARDGDPSRALAEILVKSGFHQGLKQIPAADRMAYLTLVADKMVGQGVKVADSGIETLQGYIDGPPARKLMPGEAAMADKYLAELRRMYPQSDLPDQVTTLQEWVAVLDKIGQQDVPVS